MTEIRILQLEDSADDVLLIRETLRDQGFRAEFSTVSTAGQLRSELRHGWDIVLCDYMMPGLRAEEALEIVREHDDDLPFILISGTVALDVAIGMMKRGLHDFVLKDSLERLGPVIEREVRDSRHRRNEKITRAELFELQKRFSDTFEQSAVGISHVDLQGRYLWVNRRFGEIVGRTPEELCGLPFSEITLPEDRGSDLEHMRMLLTGELRSFNREKRYVRPDGTSVWVLLTVNAVRDEDGNLRYFATVIQDVTEKKVAEERALRSERFLRGVLDSLPFEVAVVDRVGDVQTVNAEWDRFAAANGARDLRSAGVGSSYLAPCPTEMQDAIRGVIAGERGVFSHEYECHSPETERWFLMNAAPLETAEGGAVITHLDITARVVAEQQLEKREQEYRTIVEAIGEGLISTDMDGEIVYANRAAYEMAGLERPALIGKAAFSFIQNPEDVENLCAKLAEAPREWIRSELEIHTARGERWVEVHIVPRYTPSGELIGRHAVVSDVTEQKTSQVEQDRLREQIEEMNRIESLGKLAGTMAHEFNNVLMGIQPFADVIERSARENPKVQSATHYIMDAVNRGRRISQEVLRFARPVPPARQSLPVPRLLDEVALIGTGILNEKITLETRAETPAAIDGDREQLIQVFTNLLVNARDAMPSGGRVSIVACQDPPETHYDFGVVTTPDQFVHFAVRDEGTGIPKELLRRVFDPLVTTKRNGTGLGLAITHQMIASHGGVVFAESSEGEGTTIHLFIPVSQEASRQ